MTTQFTEAGKAILNFAYQVCAEYEVPREQIGELLLKLGESVIIGQSTPAPVPAEPVVVTTPQLPLDTRIRELWKAGKPKFEIAKELHCHWSTVHKHVKALPEPLSDPASE